MRVHPRRLLKNVNISVGARNSVEKTSEFIYSYSAGGKLTSSARCLVVAIHLT